MRMKAVKALYILSIILVFSCSNDSTFDKGDPASPDISLVTLASGTLIGADGSIPVSLSFSEDYKKRGAGDPLTLEGVLKDPEGEVLATVVFGPDRLVNGVYPSITLPDLEPGYYHLTFTLRNNNAVLSEETLTFFHDPRSYSLSKISSYPLSFLPGSSGIFRAYGLFPEGKDPYIRWTMDGKIILESPVSEGGDKVFWTAPKKEGVYSVKAELFPYKPKAGDRFSFSSPLTLTSQVFVSGAKRLQETDFIPETAYYSLFHFLGNLADDGTRADKPESSGGHLEIIGSPKLDFVGEVFGYSLQGDSGFEAKQILLPRSKGRLLPFTLRMLLYPRDVNSARSLFLAASDDRSFGFELFTDTSGGLVMRIESAGLFLEKPTGIILPGDKASLVELSLVPEENRLAVSWALNGTIVTSSADPFVLPEVPDSGFSRIAGKKGFIGIVDEIGIRMDKEIPSEPVPSSSAPREVPEKEKVLFSLENGIRDLNIESEGPRLLVRGKVDFEKAAAAIHPGASLTVGPFKLSGGVYDFGIQSDLLADSNRGELTFQTVAETAESSRALFSLKRGETGIILYFGDKQAGTITEKGPLVPVRILRLPEHMEAAILDHSSVLPSDPSVPSSISLIFGNLPDAKSAVLIRDLVVRQEAEDPVKRLLEAFGTETKN
jgi:hypothetical protein